MSALRFAKYEGIGNDFIVVDSAGGPDARPVDAAEARALCDRHFGVGADGVLLAGVRADGPFMRVLNADGSEPEMCGNGLRCVVLHLLRRGHALGDAFSVGTAAGPHAVRVVRADGRMAVVDVAMRAPSFAPTDVPLAAKERFVGGTLTLAAGTVRGTAVSMGNPHFVTFDDVAPSAREPLAVELQHHALFPQSVNVGFAHRLPDDSLELAVYERGVGWTLACGTGACAAVAAAVEEGLTTRGERVAVALPGGTLSVVIGAPGEHARMTGPARHVFDGEWAR